MRAEAVLDQCMSSHDEIRNEGDAPIITYHRSMS